MLYYSIKLIKNSGGKTRMRRGASVWPPTTYACAAAQSTAGGVTLVCCDKHRQCAWKNDEITVIEDKQRCREHTLQHKHSKSCYAYLYDVIMIIIYRILRSVFVWMLLLRLAATGLLLNECNIYRLNSPPYFIMMEMMTHAE